MSQSSSPDRTPLIVDSAEDNLLGDQDDEQGVSSETTTVCPSSKCGGAIFHPAGRFHRFFVFAFMCFLSFGNYFCYDTPSSLQTAILKDIDVDNEQYGVLYSVYSWPNVILAFFGGYTIDKFLGVRLGAVLFASFIALGQLVFAVGAFFKYFPVMILGRLLFAVGGESLAVAQNTYIVKWFKGKELNTVFGIQLSFARIGSTINQASMLLVYEWISKHYFSGSRALGMSLFIAFLTTVMSLFCGLILCYFDKKRDDYLALKVAQSKASTDEQQQQPLSVPVKFQLKDILKFPFTLWLCCVICVAFYAAIFPLVSFGQMFYVNKYHLTPYAASICNGLIYLVAIPCSIFGGILVDYVGRNAIFVAISVVIALVDHTLLAFTFISPFVITVIFGVAYSLLAASLWPCVAYIVPQNALATAYGVMQSIQNLGLALIFIGIGALVDHFGYLMLESVFILFLSIAFTTSLILFYVDKIRGGLLTLDAKSRNEKLKVQ